jgi:uncharacterized protein YbcV (DUF1398 family)
VNTYDSFITDGPSEYLGEDGHKVVEAGNQDKFLERLGLHEQGETRYLEMSKGLADSGVEKWTFDTGNMTIAYYDKVGNEMLIESIK